jgi:hypothetical protein
MSFSSYIEDEITQPKNDIIISNFNLGDNDNYIEPLKPIEEEKSLGEDSMMANFIKSQFIKEMSDKNIISDDIECLGSFSPESRDFSEDSNNLNDFNNYSDGQKEYDNGQKCIINLEDEDDSNYQLFNLNANLSFSSQNKNICVIQNNDNLYNSDNNKANKKKIFEVIKVSRYDKENNYLLKKRRGRGRGKSKKQKADIDWDNIPVPKEKHFHLDRKKKRIVFQRKHLKFIYSIGNLEPPLNFEELFNLIKEHVGDKTLANYGNGKSYHIIRIRGQILITTFKEKKMLLNSLTDKK